MYTMVLDAADKSKDRAIAERVFGDLLADTGVQPNVYHFAALFSLYNRLGDV